MMPESAMIAGSISTASTALAPRRSAAATSFPLPAPPTTTLLSDGAAWNGSS